MTDAEIETLVTYLASNPMAGVELAGTGGCRKLRWAGRGKGKSGGYRVVTFYTGVLLPVFLITVFSKGERASLSKSETNELAVLTKRIAGEYEAKIVKVGIRRK